ncbi:C-C chemokine receptor type 7-like [Alosa sapidissima]|uniref:C-C chemokine receptor type 7-like n=1 Tax=Alosa sapidissima TaxID=34773 RepID=UPI001C095621|nr:C-C chemokine receptor type 7-like [Alosa sapidissima]
MQYHNSSSANITSNSLGNQIASTVMGLCFALGIPGNIMTVFFILRHCKKDNFSLHLMLNLAASDILLLMTVPLWIYNLLNGWTLGSAFCKVLFTVGFIGVNSSVFTVTLMSVQRYVVVLHRDQWAKLGRKGERTLLLCVWVLACVLSIQNVLTADTMKKESKLKCSRLTRSVEERLAILVLEFLLVFVVPFSIIVLCYCRLHTKVLKSVFGRKLRLTKLMTRIVVIFLIFSCPINLLYPVEIVSLSLKTFNPHVSENLHKFYLSCINAASGLIYINSCVNPLLYAFAFKKLFEGT